jgi:hypothetical protein
MSLHMGSVGELLAGQAVGTRERGACTMALEERADSPQLLHRRLELRQEAALQRIERLRPSHMRAPSSNTATARTRDSEAVPCGS